MLIVDINKNTAKKKRKLHLCPKCKNNGGQRKQRPLLVKWLLFWLPIKIYHCKICGKKFMTFGSW